MGEESAVRTLCEAGDDAAAATAALQLYGGELLGFLVHVASNDAVALDAFSLLAENIWRSLPGFRWESSLRTWCFVLARRALSRAGRRQGKPKVPLSTNAMQQIADSISSASMPLLRAQQREKLAELRARLSEDERLLLTLRVDKELSWRDVADVMGELPEGAAPEEVKRVTAGLRKRFERTATRLRELARQEGIVEL